MLEAELYQKLKSKQLRLVLNPRRARKLRNRGENIRWCQEVGGWVWGRFYE